MKKIVLVIMLSLGIGIESFGQEPCVPLNKSPKTLEDFKRILKNDQLLKEAYAVVFSQIFNKEILSDSKEFNLVLKNSVLVPESSVNPDDYLNGVKYNEEIFFSTSSGTPSEYWVAFYFNNKMQPYAKFTCMNPQLKKIKEIVYVPVEKKENNRDIETNYPEKVVESKEPPQQYQQPSQVKKEKTMRTGLNFTPDGSYYYNNSSYYYSGYPNGWNGNNSWNWNPVIARVIVSNHHGNLNTTTRRR